MTPNTTEGRRLPPLDFESFLAVPMRDYLDYLDHLGFSVLQQAHNLRRIDRLLVQYQIHDVRQLDLTLMMRLVQQDRQRLRATTVRLYQHSFKQFCSYLVRGGWLRHNPLEAFPTPRKQPYQPHVFSPHELACFFDSLQARAAQAQSPLAFYRACSYYTLYHLLYAAGLRISEAVALHTTDYSPQQAHLFIRASKFRKERLIPIGRRVCCNLNNLLSLRAQLLSTGSADRLFVQARRGQPCQAGSVSSHFRYRLRRLGIYSPRQYQQGVLHGTPHLHELRRAFAVHRLLRWYRQGVDLHVKLPLLATYLGHSCFEQTQVYLTLTRQLLAAAAQRFATHCDHLDWVKDDSQLR
jgi:site-specific recombinase XerD